MLIKKLISWFHRLGPLNIARSRAWALLVSFFLASTFWFLVNLNKTYTASLRFPAKVLGVPDTIELHPKVFPSVELSVEGLGGTLMSYLLRLQRDTLNIGFSRDSEKGFLLTKNMASAWQGTLQGVRLVSVLGPDSLHYSLDYKVEKWLPLASQVEVKLATSHILEYPPSLFPDSVRIIGPKRMVDTLDYWLTEPLTTAPLSKEQVIEVGIVDTFSTIQVSPRVALIQVKPVLYSQTDLSIPIRLINLPPDIDIKLEKQYLSLTCLVPLSMFEQIQGGSYESVIDYRTIDPNIPYLLPDNSKLPPEIKVVYSSPQRIPYIIVKK